MQQPNGVYNDGQFRWSSMYRQLRLREILRESMLQLHGDVEVRPYPFGDVAYLSRPYLLKNFRINDPILHDKARFNFAMNSGRVVIE